MLRTLLKTILRNGQENDFWPMALLLFAVLVPAVCLLWFMGAAMRNERLASRQKLADAYRLQLSAAQRRLQEYWNQTALQCETWATGNSPSAAFAKCVQSGLFDSVIIYDERGLISYPSA